MGERPKDLYVAHVRDQFPGGAHLVDHLDDGPWSFVLVDTFAAGDLHIITMALNAYEYRPGMTWAGKPLSVASPGYLHLLPAYALANLEYHDEHAILAKVEGRSWDTSAEASVHWAETLLLLTACDPAEATTLAAKLGDDLGRYTLLHHGLSNALGGLGLTEREGVHASVVSAITGT